MTGVQTCALPIFDQGISVNTSYNPQFYEDEKIPMSELIQHILMFYKYGGKQLYFNNTHDGQGELDVDRDLANSTDLEDDEDCDSCTL